ncbi:MAG: type II toxin-antitoxin system VapC family toxin [Gammaproteobacteria bacterium]|nr:type II toxin-antitoxin system VapC family toxin [Gammaproteobacteria bacterium]
MILPDVNVLVYAHRRDTPDHEAYRSWLESVLDADSAYGMSELVLSGFLRVVTHPRVFKQPSSLRDAMTFANQLRGQGNCVPVAPGRAHWRIFSRLCSDVDAKGNLVPDAYYAALAIEHGCEWITTDRDFSRFTGLKWRHPMS